MLVFLVRGIFELRPSDRIGCLDMCTKFHIDWSSHSIVSRDRHADTHIEDGDLTSELLFFSKIREAS
jgi:hypothetical protein